MIGKNAVIVTVEAVDIIAPAFGESFDLLRADIATGAHDQDIVAEFTIRFGGDFLFFPVYVGDIGNDEVDARHDELTLAPANFLRCIDIERQNQISGLVVVDIVFIDDGDRPVIIQMSSHFVGYHCAGGAGSEHDDFVQEGVSPYSILAFQRFRQSKYHSVGYGTKQ